MLMKTYRLLSNIFSLPLFIYFLIRLLVSKENVKSLLEKFSFKKSIRPVGDIIWINGVSIGEAKTGVVIANEIKKIYPNYTVLMSTSTITSYNLLSKEKKNFILIYSPLDFSFIVKRFIDFWRPKSTIFIESEIWPNIFYYLKKNSIELSIFNARISLNSFSRWKKVPFFANQVFSLIENCFVQDFKSKDYFERLGVKKVKKIENLKFLSQELYVNKKIFSYYEKLLKKMNVITLFSSHEGEEELLMDCYETLSKKISNLLFIIVPRHVNRTKGIINELEKRKLSFALRTQKQNTLKNKKFLIVNTFGELGCFFKLSKISLVGGSFENIGGHNPIETRDFNCALIFGPHMQNFNDIKDEILKNKAGFEVDDKKQLINKIVQLINDEKLNLQTTKNFKELCRKHSNRSKLLLKNLLK